jgi:hypothetical protein
VTRPEEMTWCDGCGVEITWGPVVIDSRSYCCQECAQGYTCNCGEHTEMDEEMRNSGATSAPVPTGYLA